MKKRIFACFFAVIAMMLSFSVYAAEDSVLLIDEAEILSEEEFGEISRSLVEVSNNQQMNIAILTVSSIDEEKTAELYATDRYEQHFGRETDGVMLFLSLEEGNRDVYVLTSGEGMDAVSDTDAIIDKIYDHLTSENYAQAMKSYIKYTDEAITDSRTFDFGFNLVISIAIGFIISLIVTGGWKSKLNSVAFKTQAHDYVKQGSLAITDSRDFFLYRHIDRREKADKSDSDTHKSSSGGTYGGSGRKF